MSATTCDALLLVAVFTTGLITAAVGVGLLAYHLGAKAAYRNVSKWRRDE